LPLAIHFLNAGPQGDTHISAKESATSQFDAFLAMPDGRKARLCPRGLESAVSLIVQLTKKFAYSHFSHLRKIESMA
jgi:hypothetical protein